MKRYRLEPCQTIQKLRHELNEWREKTRALDEQNKSVKVENDALRASLRDMVEYAEEYANLQGAYDDTIHADIAKARELIK